MIETPVRKLPLAAFALAALLAACATAPPAHQKPTTAAPPTPTAAGRTVLEPPAGVWLVDDQGREYFLVEHPRHQNEYLWIEEGKRVRLRWRDEYDVESFDDTRFRAKLYRVPEDTTPPAIEPGAAQLA